MQVRFHFMTTVSLHNRLELKKFLVILASKEGHKLGDLNVVFCDDEYLLQVNRDYLGHDYYTDIITFDLAEPGAREIAGDIYISVDRVRDNAKSFGNSIKEELHRVIFHGLHHLCGYCDKSASARKIMRAKEDYYISLYNQ